MRVYELHVHCFGWPAVANLSCTRIMWRAKSEVANYGSARRWEPSKMPEWCSSHRITFSYTWAVDDTVLSLKKIWTDKSRQKTMCSLSFIAMAGKRDEFVRIEIFRGIEPWKIANAIFLRLGDFEATGDVLDGDSKCSEKNKRRNSRGIRMIHVIPLLTAFGLMRRFSFMRLFGLSSALIYRLTVAGEILP